MGILLLANKPHQDTKTFFFQQEDLINVFHPKIVVLLVQTLRGHTGKRTLAELLTIFKHRISSICFTTIVSLQS